MTTSLPISDEELTAYLDGELKEARRLEVEEALSRDPRLRARLEALDVPIAEMKAGFESVMAMAPTPPAQLGNPPETRAGTLVPVRRLALVASLAAAICLSLGWWAGGGLDRGSSLEDWRDYAAAYHALYVPDTLNVVDLDAQEKGAQIARVSLALGAEIALLERPIEGIEFRRAQVLGFEGKPLIQLAFQSDQGVPFALCITHEEASEDSELSFEERHRMASASWSRNGLSYMLIGGQDSGLTKRLAERIVARL